MDGSLVADTAHSAVGNGAEPLAGYDVVDEIGGAISNDRNVCTDRVKEPVFGEVKTDWLFGKNHLVPIHHG